MKKSKYPELMVIAEKIADSISVNINEQVKDVQSNMPYKVQWVLEETIKILQERV